MATGKEMANTGPGGFIARAFEFSRQVRQEFNKITWPTRKETTMTTMMVLVMVILAAIFFLVSDLIIGWAVDSILGIGR